MAEIWLNGSARRGGRSTARPSAVQGSREIVRASRNTRRWWISISRVQSQQDPSWALSHLAGHALGTAGYAMGGFPGSMAGEALGMLGVKPMIKKMFKGARQELRGEGHSGGLPADDRSAVHRSAARSSSRRYDQEPDAGQCVLNDPLAVFSFHHLVPPTIGMWCWIGRFK